MRRQNCDLPHIPAERAETHILHHWRKRRITTELVALARDNARADAAAYKAANRKLVASQAVRIERLEERRQRLIDAHLDGAIRLEDLKHRQSALDADTAEARKILSIAQINTTLFDERLELALALALALLEQCDRLYTENDDQSRRDLNQVFFSEIRLDQDGVVDAVLNSPFVELSRLHDRTSRAARRRYRHSRRPGTSARITLMHPARTNAHGHDDRSSEKNLIKEEPRDLSIPGL